MSPKHGTLAPMTATAWLMFVTGAAIAAVVCQWRMRGAAKRAIQRHEMLLQSLQGIKMIADDALDRPDDIVALRRSMEEISKWLGRASLDGSKSLHELRRD